MNSRSHAGPCRAARSLLRLAAASLLCPPALILLTGSPPRALAATWTWNGSQGNDHWTNSGNWTPAVPALVNDGTANIMFDGFTRLMPDMNMAWSVNSVTFSTTGGGFDLISSSSSALTIGAGGITDNDTVWGQAIENAITLGAAQTWNLGGALSVSGAVDNGGNLLTINSPLFTTILSGVLSGAGGVTKNGAGGLALVGSSANSFTGPVTVNDGSLALSKSNGAIPTAAFNSAVLNIGDGIGVPGSAVLMNSTGNLPTGTFVNVSIKEDGLFNCSLTTNSDNIASLTMRGGTVLVGFEMNVHGDVTTLASSSTATIAQGFFVIHSGGTHMITVAQGTTPTGIDLDISARVETEGAAVPIIKAGPGTMRLSAKNDVFDGGLTVTAGTVLIGDDNALGTGTLTMNGGAIQADGAPRTVSNAVNFIGTGIIGGNVNLTLNGPITGPGGLIKNGSSTLTLAGSNTLAGPITINAGGLVMNTSLIANVTNQASFVYNAGSFGGRLTNAGAVTFNADFTAGNGLENDSILTLPTGRSITLNGAGLNNQGTFTMAGGNLFLSTSGAANNVNSGTFLLPATLNLAGATLTNTGTFVLSGGTLTGSGTFTNASGGTVSGFGTISVTNFLNSGGTLYAQGGTLHLGNPISSFGSIQVAAGATLNGASLINSGYLSGAGTVANNLTNNGTIEPVGGTFTIAGTFTNIGTGTIFATIGNKILVQSGLAINAGIIDLSGGTFDNANNPLNNTGSILGYGSFRTGGAGLTNNGSILFAGGSTTINGLVTNSPGHTIEVRNTPAIFTNNVSNAGVFKSTNTTVTFLGTFTGGLTSDPATNIFRADVTIPLGNAFTGGPGDIFDFSGGTVTNQGTFTNGGTLISASPILNTGAFTQSGPQTWFAGTTFTNNAGAATFGSDSGSISASPLAMVVNAGSISLAASQHLASLTLSGGSASITAGTTRTSAVAFGGSAANWSGDVDLTTHKLIVQATAGTKAAVLSNLQAQAAFGRTHPAGITSSSLLANMAVAVVDNGGLAVPLATFGGQTVDANSFLIAPELLGDANIDGTVNFADFVLLSNHFGASNAGWVGADFNSDGVTNFADFVSLSNNFGAVIGLPFTANLTAAGPGEMQAAETAAVPEPASLVLMFLAGAPMLYLRKR